MKACQKVGRRLIVALLLITTGNGMAMPNTNHPARFKVNPLHLENGPSRDWVFTAVRDATGYLWVGTDNGLRRYDGYEYTVFTTNPDDPGSLASSQIFTLMIDSAQKLWVGGRAISVYQPETDTFENYPVLDGNIVLGLAESPDGILWAGTEVFGLVGFDMRKNDRHDSSILWMTSSTGIFRFDTKTHEFQRLFSTRELDQTNLVVSSMLAMDRDGNLWVATRNGLYVVDPDNKTFRHYMSERDNPRALSTNILTSIFIDSKDRVWIGTDKQGVHLYQSQTDDFIHIPSSATEPGTFGPAAIPQIFEDQNGSLWFAVSSFGPQRLSPHLDKFLTIGSGPGEKQLSWELLLDLLEDRHGNIWIATDGGGLNRYDPKTGRITRYLHDPGNRNSLSTNSVISLEEDRHGIIWIGTWAGGLNRLDPVTGKFTHYRHDPAAPKNSTLGNDNIFQVAEDEDGWLWLSVWNFGLQRFNAETGEFVTFHYNDKNDNSGMTEGSVNAIETSRYGHRWIGGYIGLQIYDPRTQRFTKVPLIKPHHQPHHEIFDLHEDPQGILWVATSEGFIRYNHETGESKQYTVDDGLADPFVASIEEDNSGRLWLGTRGGLSRFDPQREVFETFDKFDGLPGDEFHRYSHLFSSDGIMYFGGANGLVLFDPDNLPENTRIPNVVLTGLELFQQQVTPGKSPYLPRNINLLDELVLPYEQRDITFKFSALSFISPTKNRYRYRLKGLESDWIEVDSSRRRVRYTNLDPGRYRFEVIGSNNEGVWNMEGAKLDLVIIPPWWMTWWARLLAAALALYAVYGFTNWRLRLNRQREKELSVEIEERRAAEAKLFHIAYHDALTGLPNRLWLLERLDEQITRAKSDKEYRFALMFIDGDRFKQINDTHGHQLGDFILDSAAKRLRTLLPDKYHAIRLGGDEFTVLVEDVKSEDEVIEICNTLITAFNEPFQVEKNLMFFKVSIGLVFCQDQYVHPGQILRDADIAMYKAKERGRGTHQVFDAKMREHTLEITQLETDLYKALEQNQLFLVYQPIINLQTGQLSGFEALTRWKHPEKGLIPPDKFIPIAEESGLILTLGSWVLRQACSQLTAWIKEYKLEKPPTIAINLSSLELNQSYFLAQVDRMLRDTGIDSTLLKLEITESTLMENSESMNLLLDELRLRQIELAIDDFGTGYSSLSYLDRLPVQVLKIDRKFVTSISNDSESNSGSIEIIKATISLAHNLNIMVVAEGIETEQQYRLLRSYGCDFGQGYYIAKPLSSEEAARFMGYEPQPQTLVSVAANSDILSNVSTFPKAPGLRRRFRNE